MKILGNIIWLLFGGLGIFFEYLIGGVLMCLTIIGIPFGIQSIKLSVLALWPFGREAVSSETQTGCLSTVMNVVWIIFAGIWIALSHLFFALILFITIIGIPFAKQHLKLINLALSPFGKEVRYIKK